MPRSPGSMVDSSRSPECACKAAGRATPGRSELARPRCCLHLGDAGATAGPARKTGREPTGQLRRRYSVRVSICASKPTTYVDGRRLGRSVLDGLQRVEDKVVVGPSHVADSRGVGNVRQSSDQVSCHRSRGARRCHPTVESWWRTGHGRNGVTKNQRKRKKGSKARFLAHHPL